VKVEAAKRKQKAASLFCVPIVCRS
jgi:hypothetical protein